jgi:ribosomal protein L13E
LDGLRGITDGLQRGRLAGDRLDHPSFAILQCCLCKITDSPRTGKTWRSPKTTVRFAIHLEVRIKSANYIIQTALVKNHFRKDWQRRVKTWFDQPGRKLRRRTARRSKAASLGVRPLTLLRPAVRAPTIRYNIKIREGRGFTLSELKDAGVRRKEAKGLGIVVDHRRRNLSEEGKKLNVERLKAYKARLIVFPKKAGKPKKGDSQVSHCWQ